MIVDMSNQDMEPWFKVDFQPALSKIQFCMTYESRYFNLILTCSLELSLPQWRMRYLLVHGAGNKSNKISTHPEPWFNKINVAEIEHTFGGT